MRRGSRRRLNEPPSSRRFFGGDGWMDIMFRKWTRIKNLQPRPPLNFNDIEITVDSLRSIRDDCLEIELHHQIATNEAQYLVEGYDEKRDEIKFRLFTLLECLWKSVPPPHLRVEYSNVISLVVTFMELFGYISETTEEEETHIPCHIIDKFEMYIITLDQIRSYGHVEMVNFTDLLDLRDEVLEHLQTYYRIQQPKEAGKKVIYPNKNLERYCPYDYEWVCGSITSGPLHLNCVKYLCVSRINQLNNTKLRCDIMCATEGDEREFITEIHVPMPTGPKDAKLLTTSLARRESVWRNVIKGAFTAIDELGLGGAEVEFAKSLSDYSNLQADLRKKKKTVSDLMVRTDRKACTPLNIIIAVLSTVECYLLVLQRTYALFVEERLGMYGRALPRNVYDLARKIYQMATVDNCKQMPLSNELESVLKDFRAQIRKYVREFFTYHEETCESQFKDELMIDEQNEYQQVYEFECADFPRDIMKHSREMIKNLNFERFEMDRLNVELNQVRQAFYTWPTDPGTPDLTLNMYRHFVDAFYNNFREVMPDSAISQISLELTPMTKKLEAQNYIGSEAVRVLHEIVEKEKCAPSISEINQEYIATFKRIFGDQLIDGERAESVGATFADIINDEMAVTGIRKRFKENKNTAKAAKRMAQFTVQRYEVYVKTHAIYEDRRKAANKKAVVSRRMFPDMNFDESEEGSSDDNDAYHSMNGETDTRMAAVFQSLNIDGTVSTVVYCDDPNVLLQYDVIPENLIQRFIDRFQRVNFHMIPNVNDPIYNVPVD